MGWGGAAYQMSPDRLKLLMLGQWSGACTPAQQAYHSTTGELFAQRCVSRERRKTLGRIPAICWSDSKSGVQQATKKDGELDIRSLRWIADIESDGSQLKNLSGRAQIVQIGDGLSRAPHDLTPELANRARSIREFSVEKFLDAREEDNLQVSTLPGHAPPVPDGFVGPVLSNAPELRPLGLVVVADHAVKGLKVEWLERVWKVAFPWMGVTSCAIQGQLTDELGQARWFDPKSGQSGDKVRRCKLLRRDFMTGVADALRALLGISGFPNAIFFEENPSTLHARPVQHFCEC